MAIPSDGLKEDASFVSLPVAVGLGKKVVFAMLSACSLLSVIAKREEDQEVDLSTVCDPISQSEVSHRRHFFAFAFWCSVFRSTRELT
jgi:hypothetical protein